MNNHEQTNMNRQKQKGTIVRNPKIGIYWDSSRSRSKISKSLDLEFLTKLISKLV